jgi:hypothetical protein
MATYPTGEWSGLQFTDYTDGSSDDQIGSEADFDELDAEVIAMQQSLRAGPIVAFHNDTGGALNAGDLVYVSGWDATASLPTVTKARADSAATRAQYVVIAGVANANDGNMARRYRETGVDTSTYSVGDYLYLDASTAGAVTTTAPSGSNIPQVVGRVAKVNASTGVIEWDVREPALVDDSTLNYASANKLQLKDGGIATAKLADDAVTYAKMQDTSATDVLLGRSTAGAGVIEEVACTAAGRALLDDADAATQRSTLGLGDLATLDSVSASEIDAGAVDTSELAANAVTAAKLAAAVAGDGLTGGGGSALAVQVDDSTVEINADTVRVKDAGITAAKLAAAVQDRVAYIALSASAEGAYVANQVRFSGQIKDLAGNNLAQRHLVRVWVSGSDHGTPDATGLNGDSLNTGTEQHEQVTGAMWDIETDATGLFELDLEDTGSGTHYVMAAVGGSEVVSASQTWA